MPQHPDALSAADHTYRVISLRRDGHMPADIAKMLGINLASVKALLSEEAKNVRQQRRELVDEAFMTSYQRVEVLWLEIWSAFEKECRLWDTGDYGHDYRRLCEMAKTLIAIEIRKSALMGLDANKTKTPDGARGQATDWLGDETVTMDQIATDARRLGLRLGGPFSKMAGSGGTADVERSHEQLATVGRVG